MYYFTAVVKVSCWVKSMTALARDIPNWFAALAKRTGAFRVVSRTPSTNATSDWIFKLQPTGGRATIKVFVAAKQRLTPREFLAFAERFPKRAKQETLVVCSPTISPRVAGLCRESGAGHLDAAGNCHIQAPGFFIHIEGQPNPHRTRRQAADPFATKSSRIARVLLTDVGRGWQVQELAREADVSLGLASRIKQALLDEAFIELREGLFFVRDPQSLLKAWQNAYQLPRRQSFYVMDTNQNIESRIAAWSAQHGVRYALTAYSGAWRLAPMVRHTMSTVYLEARDETDLAPLIAELGAKQVESGANLSIWQPHDEYTYYDTRTIKGIHLVSALQLYLDLVQLSGRGGEAAEEIFVKELEPKWQS